MENKLSISIVGDIYPTGKNKTFFEDKKLDKFFNGTLNHLQSADFTLCNLECPATNKNNGIDKIGPLLRIKPEYLDFLKKAGLNVFSLANNHIKDYGEQGVLDTINKCKELNIHHFGAAENLYEAKKPLILKKNNISIGFMSFAEQEFNIASENSAGANFLDPLYDYDLIRATKSKVDYLIILYHGGIEYYKYPSPILQKKCRKMVESGADLVTCQHSHCIGTTEVYNGSSIIYGQGNFIFGYKKNQSSWNEGFLINLRLEKLNSSLKSELSYKLIKTNSDGSLDINEKDEAKRIKDMSHDSKILKDSYLLQKKWNQFALKKSSDYMSFIFGFNKIILHLNRLLNNKVATKLYSRKKIMINKNIMTCEAHKELIQTIFENHLK